MDILRDFRGAGVCIGQGGSESTAARQAIKLALMLTNPDGAAYCPGSTRVLFDATDDEIAEKTAGLVHASEQQPFDCLCLYVAGEVTESSDGVHLHNGSAGTTITFAAIAELAARIRSDATIVFLDVATESPAHNAGASQKSPTNARLRPRAIDLQAALTHVPEPTAIVVGQSARSAQSAQSARSDGAGKESSVTRSGPLADSETVCDFLLEWLVGRDTSADAELHVQSLRRDAKLAPRVHLDVAATGDEQQIRLGARFPWLVWSGRTTIPGHAVRSLHDFVDQNGAVIASRVQQKVGLSAQTLSGLPQSLYALIYRESLADQDLDLIDRLQRDRGIVSSALRANGFNRSATAHAMGISRSTLYQKLRRLNISIEQLKNADRR